MESCFFPPLPVFDVLFENVNKKLTAGVRPLRCLHGPVRQKGDGLAFNHLFQRRDWNALELHRCLHFVSVPGGGYALARRYKTNTFEGSRSNSHNHKLMLSFLKTLSFFFFLLVSLHLSGSSAILLVLRALEESGI